MAELGEINSDIIFYTTPDGVIRVEVLYQDETFWLTINRMAELFGTSKQSISYHLQNIYKENELYREATVKEILTVQIEGQREVSRKLEYYNLYAFLQFNEYEVLQNAGKISHQVDAALAEGEYNKLQDQQFESDFDKTIKELERRS